MPSHMGASRLFGSLWKRSRIFFREKNIFSGQNRIFDPFSRVSGPGRCPKRSGTSFSSSLHYWMPQNLFPAPALTPSSQICKIPNFPSFFLHFPQTLLPSRPLSSKLPSLSTIPSPPSLPPLVKQKFSSSIFCQFFSFGFLTLDWSKIDLWLITNSQVSLQQSPCG